MERRLTDLAARVAARAVRRAQAITERYSEAELAVTKDEADRHMADYGHIYDDDCQAEFCQRWRKMYEDARTAMMGGK